MLLEFSQVLLPRARIFPTTEWRLYGPEFGNRVATSAIAGRDTWHVGISIAVHFVPRMTVGLSTSPLYIKQVSLTEVIWGKNDWNESSHKCSRALVYYWPLHRVTLVKRVEFCECSKQSDSVTFALEFVGDALGLGSTSMNDCEASVVVRHCWNILKVYPTKYQKD